MTFPMRGSTPLNVELDPDIVTQFTAEYAPTSELWGNVAANLQTIIDTFREHASRHVENGGVAPLLSRTDELFLAKIQGLLDAVILFRDYIVRDVEIMRTMADTMQALEAETAAQMNRTDIPS